jgi:hypothetical protein
MRADSCALASRGDRNTPPLETGATRGKLRNAEGAGKPAPDAGAWHRRAARSAGKAGQPAGLVRRGQMRPPPSHTWRGPHPLYPDVAVFPGLSRPQTSAAKIPPNCGTRRVPAGRMRLSHRCGRPRSPLRAARSLAGRRARWPAREQLDRHRRIHGHGLRVAAPPWRSPRPGPAASARHGPPVQTGRFTETPSAYGRPIWSTWRHY